jgi:hypothetical protein
MERLGSCADAIENVFIGVAQNSACLRVPWKAGGCEQLGCKNTECGFAGSVAAVVDIISGSPQNSILGYVGA